MNVLSSPVWCTRQHKDSLQSTALECRLHDSGSIDVGSCILLHDRIEFWAASAQKAELQSFTGTRVHMYAQINVAAALHIMPVRAPPFSVLLCCNSVQLGSGHLPLS